MSFIVKTSVERQGRRHAIRRLRELAEIHNRRLDKEHVRDTVDEVLAREVPDLEVEPPPDGGLPCEPT